MPNKQKALFDEKGFCVFALSLWERARVRASGYV
jgi:hypothetical protein